MLFLRTLFSRIGSTIIGCVKLQIIAGEMRHLTGTDKCFSAVSAAGPLGGWHNPRPAAKCASRHLSKKASLPSDPLSFSVMFCVSFRASSREALRRPCCIDTELSSGTVSVVRDLPACL